MTDQQHVLYRMYDGDDHLLYVGITLDVAHRFADHRQGKTWWADVATIRLEHFGTRADLEAAEVAAIVAERPVHNVQREFRSADARESTRRQKALPANLRYPFEVVRRYAHRGRGDQRLQECIGRARDLGISEDDIEWALDHPWNPTYAAKEPAGG